MEVKVCPLTRGLTDDFIRFFDDAAFTDNKEWAGCYCYFYHYERSDEEFNQRTGESNRLSSINLIQEGKMKGYLAYHNGEPIGWCNANDKINYSRLVSNHEVWDEAGKKICSIVCFVIAPKYRKKGIASQLLKEICSDYADKGYEYVEAYPRKGELTSAQHYHGPLSMYLKAGFFLHKEFANYDIVRKKLNNG